MWEAVGSGFHFDQEEFGVGDWMPEQHLASRVWVTAGGHNMTRDGAIPLSPVFFKLFQIHVLTFTGGNDGAKPPVSPPPTPSLSPCGTSQPLLPTSLEDISSISASFFRAGQFLWQRLD